MRHPRLALSRLPQKLSALALVFALVGSFGATASAQSPARGDAEVASAENTEELKKEIAALETEIAEQKDALQAIESCYAAAKAANAAPNCPSSADIEVNISRLNVWLNDKRAKYEAASGTTVKGSKIDLNP